MSEKNVEVVRGLFRYWERGEWAGGRELVTNDCEIVFSTSWFPDAGAYEVGREALGAWVAFTNAFEEFSTGYEKLLDTGQQVVALTWLRGRGRSSGADVHAKVGVVFSFRDGKVARY